MPAQPDEFYRVRFASGQLFDQSQIWTTFFSDLLQAWEEEQRLAAKALFEAQKLAKERQTLAAKSKKVLVSKACYIYSPCLGEESFKLEEEVRITGYAAVQVCCLIA